MERKEILKKIAHIQKELEQDQFKIIHEKILDRPFYLHKSHRNIFLRKIIHALRRRLAVEVNLILEPILENQKEINLRFLKEIKHIKEVLAREEMNKAEKENEDADFQAEK